jgi:hypothetical protein
MSRRRCEGDRATVTSAFGIEFNIICTRTLGLVLMYLSPAEQSALVKDWIEAAGLSSSVISDGHHCIQTGKQDNGNQQEPSRCCNFEVISSLGMLLAI